MPGKNTVIVIGAPLGRVGSSALMGLLNLSGVNIGGKKSGLGKASSSNPKGHFEPPAIKDFLKAVFPESFPGLSTVPTIKQLQAAGKKHYNQFKVLLNEEFGSTYPKALKGGRLLVLPFLQPLQKEFTVKVLMMHRQPKDQLASIIRVWNKSPKLKRHATVQYLTPILNRWTNFVNVVRKAYTSFNYFDVQFEELINDPVNTMQQIAKFTGIGCPSSKVITQWIDPRLTNRK